MNEKEFDRLIDEASHISLPEGLSSRLEAQIDEWAFEEKKQKRHRLIYWASGVAAAAVICIGIFLAPAPHHPADTYSDPEEAALAAAQALSLMSTQFNKGMAQVSTAKDEFEKVNEIINKHFNE
jgi:hypothetical protein